MPLVVHYFATKWKGISNRDAGFDHERHYDAIKDATLEFGWDFTPTNGMFAADGYAALGTTQLRWPGGDLPDDASFQFVEGEYMKAEEYDEFLADPNGFTLTKIFPRIASGLQGFADVPLPPLYWMANTYYLHERGRRPARRAADPHGAREPAGHVRRRGRRTSPPTPPTPRRWPPSATRAPGARRSSRPSTWSPTCSARCAAARSTCTATRSSCWPRSIWCSRRRSASPRW